MQAHYRSSAILIGCLLLPFGVAIYEDAKAEDAGGLGSYADDLGYDYGQAAYDDYDDDEDALRDYAEFQRAQAQNGEYEEILNDYGALNANQPPSSMGVSFFDATFFADGTAKAPALSGPFAGIAFGQAKAGVQALFPDAGAWPLALPEYPEASADFEFVGDRLGAITVRFPDDGSALRSFTAQWGAPSPAAKHGSDLALWHDDKQKLQARLLSNSYDAYASVTLRPYQELTDFIAPGARLFGFEESDILSLGSDDIQALRTSSDYEDQIILHQPHFAGIDAPVAVVLAVRDARVASATIDLDLDVETSTKLYQLIEAKLGRPSEKGGDEWGQFYTFKKGSRIVTLNTDGHGWSSIQISGK